MDCSIHIPQNDFEKSEQISKDPFIESKQTENKITITDIETFEQFIVPANSSPKQTCETENIVKESCNMTDDFQIPSNLENDVLATSPSIFEKCVNNMGEIITGQEVTIEEIVISSNNTTEYNLEGVELTVEDRNITNNNKNDTTIDISFEHEEIIRPSSANTSQNFEDRDFIPLESQTPLIERSSNTGKRPRKGRKRKI